MLQAAQHRLFVETALLAILGYCSALIYCRTLRAHAHVVVGVGELRREAAALAVLWVGPEGEVHRQLQHPRAARQRRLRGQTGSVGRRIGRPAAP